MHKNRIYKSPHTESLKELHQSCNSWRGGLLITSKKTHGGRGYALISWGCALTKIISCRRSVGRGKAKLVCCFAKWRAIRYCQQGECSLCLHLLGSLRFVITVEHLEAEVQGPGTVQEAIPQAGHQQHRTRMAPSKSICSQARRWIAGIAFSQGHFSWRKIIYNLCYDSSTKL